MKLLTSKAIQGYRDYTKRTIAYAKYKVGSTYHKTKIESVDVTEEGIVEVRFKIEAATTGAATVTEIQLYDTNNDLWLSKQEFLEMNSVAEAFIMSASWKSVKGRLKNNARTCELERSCGSVSRKVRRTGFGRRACATYTISGKSRTTGNSTECYEFEHDGSGSVGGYADGIGKQ